MNRCTKERYQGEKKSKILNHDRFSELFYSGSSRIERISMRHPQRLLSFAILTSVLLVQPVLSQTQSPDQQGASTRSSSAAQTKGQQAQPNCTSNGTYTNSKGQTVNRPENCSSAP